MFKDKLHDLMTEKGIDSKRQLSTLTKIPPTTISGWFNAGRLPDYSAIKKISQFFEISADEVLEQTEYDARINTPHFSNINLSEKEKALLDAFNDLLPETQDFVLRTVKSLRDKKGTTTN